MILDKNYEETILLEKIVITRYNHRPYHSQRVYNLTVVLINLHMLVRSAIVFAYLIPHTSKFFNS